MPWPWVILIECLAPPTGSRECLLARIPEELDEDPVPCVAPNGAFICALGYAIAFGLRVPLFPLPFCFCIPKLSLLESVNDCFDEFPGFSFLLGDSPCLFFRFWDTGDEGAFGDGEDCVVSKDLLDDDVALAVLSSRLVSFLKS